MRVQAPMHILICHVKKSTKGEKSTHKSCESLLLPVSINCVGPQVIDYMDLIIAYGEILSLRPETGKLLILL